MIGSMGTSDHKILLIGFRGVGKTTIGKKLAERLGLEFLDLDEEIEKREGRTIAEIVQKMGWGHFRELEKIALRSLFGRSNLVCALGGGAVLHSEEMKHLKDESTIVWLKTDLKTIEERLKGDPKTNSSRPKLTDLNLTEEIAKIYGEREPLYRQFSHLIVETSHIDNIEHIVDLIVGKLYSLKKSGGCNE